MPPIDEADASADAEAASRMRIEVVVDVRPPPATPLPLTVPPPPTTAKPRHYVRGQDAAGSAHKGLIILDRIHEPGLYAGPLRPSDLEEELALRKVRDEVIKEHLRAGRSVCYRSSGMSLRPRVQPGDQTTYKPVTSADEVQVDDIVFCQAQPGTRFNARLVKSKESHEFGWLFTVSNSRGRKRGLCRIEHIYGRMVESHP